MKYFFNVKFNQIKPTFLGIQYSNKSKLDIISIVIDSEPISVSTEEVISKQEYGEAKSLGRKFEQYKYYAISKEFNFELAWNNEVIRETVLKEIYTNLCNKLYGFDGNAEFLNNKNTHSIFKELLSKYGKTNKQILEDIDEFTNTKVKKHKCQKTTKHSRTTVGNMDFYIYYDEVLFSKLFKNIMPISIIENVNEIVVNKYELNNIYNYPNLNNLDFTILI